ncbi:MAG: UDP-N-acetylglucosamine 2-epimerase (non-hydrolyzing) [Candidatus Margulisbacteria bacterium]|nr:UDP-N-acetylglucosamine 2-epimerase (non-hydrolyzing) [Candidatus Margulisiibacteriota bacterium]
MKILTILGTRPEIIRLSRIIPLLDTLCEHKVVYTGQNYDPNLSTIFFKELKVRKPDHIWECQGKTTMQQISKILINTEKTLKKEKPDRLLILGDTNSGLSSIVAKRLGIPVYHMEAGNRCYDDRVPEEVNRRIIDHSSDILLPYTQNSRQNLLKEGIPDQRIQVTGNPIKEVLDYFSKDIKNSNILEQLKLTTKKYFLVTLHRAENVDIPERLNKFIKAFQAIYKQYNCPLVCSMHPRTRTKLKESNTELRKKGIISITPPGLFNFINLELNARCVLTDSGTVQEECCIFHIPAVTIRDVTERPETIEVGSNILSGAEPKSILTCVQTVLDKNTAWVPPPEYLMTNVSQTVAKIILSHRKP